MKPQVRHEVVRAVLPALAGAGVLVLLWGLHYLAWRHFAARFGYADRHQTIGVTPINFWHSGYLPSIFSDWNAFIIWVSACFFFMLGPFVAFLLSKSRAAHIFSAALLLGVITHGCLDAVSVVVYVVAITTRHVTFVRVAQLAWPAFAWIFALSFGGAAVGIALQRIARAIERRADRQNAPART